MINRRTIETATVPRLLIAVCMLIIIIILGLSPLLIIKQGLELLLS